MKHTRFTAFTLVELLVVIGIIATLAAILFPVFAQAREKARQATCQSNMRQIGVAITLYSEDQDGQYPLHQFASGQSDYAALPPRAEKPWDAGNWVWSTHPYLENWGVLLCPSASKMDGFGSTNPATLYTNYTMNGYLHGSGQSSVANTAETFLLVEGVGSRAADGYGACFPVPRWSPPDPSVHEYAFFIRDGIGVNHGAGSVYAYVDGHVKWQPCPSARGMVNHLPLATSADFNIRLFTPWED